MTPTTHELQILSNIVNSEYCGGGPVDYPVWSWSVCRNRADNAALGSCIAKGWATSSQWDKKETVIAITQAGYDVYLAAQKKTKVVTASIEIPASAKPKPKPTREPKGGMARITATATKYAVLEDFKQMFGSTMKHIRAIKAGTGFCVIGEFQLPPYSDGSVPSKTIYTVVGTHIDGGTNYKAGLGYVPTYMDKARAEKVAKDTKLRNSFGEVPLIVMDARAYEAMVLPELKTGLKSVLKGMLKLQKELK